MYLPVQSFSLRPALSYGQMEDTMKNRFFLRHGGKVLTSLATLSLIVAGIILASQPGATQSSKGTGVISGTVTADRGVVRGFRVKVKDTAHKITYTVFSRRGQYKVSDLPPSSYEVRVLQRGFESPVETVALGAGETKTANLALKAEAPPPSTVQLVDYDTLYPPGPGRDLLEVTCMGCHGKGMFHRQQRNADGWRASVELMLSGPMPGGQPAPALGRTNMPARDKEAIVQYLASNFGPNSPKRDLKLDELLVDEDAVADALFVEYDAPKMEFRRPGRPNPNATHFLHDPYLDAEGQVWYPSVAANSIVRLNPREMDPEKRWKEWVLPENSGWVFLHGITVDSKNHLFWAEINGGRVGELDPQTGEMTRHSLPTLGSVLQVAVDSKDNIWYGQVHGVGVGRIDAKTRRVKQWPTPTPDASAYGLAIDQKDRAWFAGYGKNVVLMVDPVSDTVKEYKTLTRAAGPRRLGVDSKGIVWHSEFLAGKIGSINSDTGEQKEYTLPLRHTHPYETWPDREDNIWITDHVYGCIIKFDRKTEKFTYYPLPQYGSFAGGGWSVPKIEVAKDNTIWFGSRGVANTVAVHWIPKGGPRE
ncbi:MAG: hypothetical protein A3H28_13405 [Acidobacteria bacterium RIFCSPLOWO2_02_FULL_61_28]|nr:MAG: hypothetical protein A3H28_13405 [Acidobacteria bacterium RIFCSPLOWO2_02_FULL_61_28]